jgi:hypothetical protein
MDEQSASETWYRALPISTLAGADGRPGSNLTTLTNDSGYCSVEWRQRVMVRSELGNDREGRGLGLFQLYTLAFTCRGKTLKIFQQIIRCAGLDSKRILTV